MVLAAVGIAVVSAAQGLISRNHDSRLGRLADLTDRLHLRDLYPFNPRTVLFAAILLVLGAALFGYATRNDRFHDTLLPAKDMLLRARAAARRELIAAALLALLGAVIWAYVMIRLRQGEYEPLLARLFWLSLIAFGLAIVVGRFGAGARRPWGLAWWEPLLVLAAIVFFVAVNLRDLDSWRYAAIGDEHAFFDYAKAMANGTLQVNVFSQFGVYNQRPIGTSEFQAISMRIFGEDSYGWRMATVIALAATIPGVYLLARELFDRQVAAFAVLIFSVSHYLIAYAHTVYDNIFAIVPFVWCLAFAAIGLRRQSPIAMYVAGIAGGLGFYTFPTARMAPIVLVAFMLTLGRPGLHPRVLLPLALGGLLAGLPLFAADGWDAISVSRDRTLFGFTDSATEDTLRRFQENIPRSILSFQYNPNPGHFVSGSLLDPISAVFFVLGLGYAAARVLKPSYRLLLIWLIVAIAFAGLLSPYNRVAYDRLHLALPVVAIIAALAVAWMGRVLMDGAREFRMPRDFRPLVVVAGFAVLAPALVWLNLDRFYIDSPKVIPTTEERMALGGLRDGCEYDDVSLAIIREPRPLLDPAIAVYGETDRQVSTRSLIQAAGMEDYDSFDCIVVTRFATDVPLVTGNETGDARANGAVLVKHLTDEYGYEPVGVITNPTSPIEAIILRSASEARGR